MARINSRLACGGRKKMACGGRPKAFWGAVIGTVLSGIGSAINARQQSDAYDEYIEQQTLQNTIQNNQQQANLINRALQNNRNMQNAYQNEFENNIRYRYGGRRKASFGWGNLFSSLGSLASVSDGFIGNKSTGLNNIYADATSSTGFSKTIGYSVNPSFGNGNNVTTLTTPVSNIKFACGGRKKARNGKRTKLTTPYITDGGVAISMGNGLSLLRGATHEDINESGQTGIGIQVGRHQIEAENGEVAQKKGRELRIFSDQPMLNGISPADAVEAGYNPDEIFAAQEIYKQILGIKDDGSSYRCGGRNKKANGGLTRDKNYGSSKKPYPSVKSSDFAGKGRSYPIPTKADARDALRLAGLHGRSDIRAKVLARYPSLRKKAAVGLIDYYDDVQEPDATRTWASSYNSRGRSIPYGAIENIGNEAYLTPVDIAIGEILMPTLYAIDEELSPQSSQQYIQSGVGPLIGKPRFARPRTIRPAKNLQTKRVENAVSRANIKKGQTWNNYGATAYGQPTTFPVRDGLATRGQIPASSISEGSLNFSTAAARRQIMANRLAKAIDAGKQRYSKFQENRATRKEAKARLKRMRNNSNTSENTNANNNQTRWQKTKAKAKKYSKRTGIAAGITIGASAIGTAINSVLTDEKINTTGNNNSQPKQQAKSQPRQQAKSQSNNQTPTSTRNINDIIRDVRNVTTKDYLTTEQRALINGPIRVNFNKGRGNRKSSKLNKQSSRRRLLKIARFTAPDNQPRIVEQRNRSIYDYSPEQIDILKGKISQLPQDRRLTRDEAIKLTGAINRIEYLNSKRNRNKKEFGGVNQLPPVGRLGRRRYANGGNGSSYLGYHYKFVPNALGGVEPQLVVEEPAKIWQRSPINNNTQIANEISQVSNTSTSTPQITTRQSGITNPYWTRNNWGLDVKGADWIGLGTDILGSIGVGLINNAALKDIKYDYTLPQYVDETPVAFDTTWHNGAQRANVERNRINARNIIGRNTASANTAVQRMQESDTNAMMEQNKLWDEKANKETELRNLAAQNEQQVRARNAAARNAYYQQIADIKNREIDANNAIRTQRGQNFATSLAGIGQAASNFLSQAGQRYEDNQALRALAASRGAIMPSMIAAGVDMDDATLAGMIYNYSQRMQDPLVKPNRSDYTSDVDYGRALSKYEDESKLREQYQNAMDLAAGRLGMSRKGRRYLNRLGLR